MGRKRSGYSSYRGRKTLNDLLKGIAVVLAVLVVLLLAGLFLGQDYLVFTDRGLRWNLPFGQEKSTNISSPGTVDVEIRPSEDEAKAAEEENALVSEGEHMAALELPVSCLADGSAQQQLEQAGANALILEMKNPEGMLSWSSEQNYARAAGVNAKTEGINGLFTTWNQGEVYTIARVCCFRDNTLPYQRNDVALRATYGNWRDELGLRWLDPGNETAQSYVAQLCEELAQMGFDELVLEACYFPWQGNLDAIEKKDQYTEEVQAERMEEFLNQVRSCVEPYGTKVSVLVSQEMLVDGAQTGGLTGQVLERNAQRIWMETDQPQQAIATLENVGLTNASERFVPVVQLFGEESPREQAVFIKEN
ncbi:MAG: putative glycoside hydrolase [Lawsonibacter sp.]|jgi:hypothetical protein